MREKNIKPILGCEFYLCDQDPCIKEKTNRRLSHLVVLAKNFEGWKKLIEATSASNDEEVFYHKPRLDLNTLAEYCDGNLISFSGHLGSQLADIIFSDSKSAYSVAGKKQKLDTHIIVVWVDNETGVLARVVGLFSGRGYNIDSLAVAEVDKKKNISRKFFTFLISQKSKNKRYIKD